MKNAVSKLSCAALILGGAAFVTPTATAGETVTMDRTHVLKLPRPASAVLVGNPDIADVSVFSDDTLFLMGRGFGQTDLLVLDAQGEVILQTDVNVVSARSPRNVTMITGSTERNTFHCQPYCRPAPVKGDDPSFVGKFEASGATAQSPNATQSVPAQAGGSTSGAVTGQPNGFTQPQ